MASGLPKIADDKDEFQQVMILYSILILVIVILTTMGTFGVFLLLLRSAYKVHEKMTSCVLKASLSFHAVNPVGRLLNRFSQDINNLQEYLPFCMYKNYFYVLPFLSTIALSIFTNFWLIVAYLVPFPLFYILCKVFFKSSTDIKRLMLVGSGPIYSHFSNTMKGLTVIRVRGRQKEFTEQLFRHIDSNTPAIISFYSSVRWFGIACSFLVTAMTVVVASIVIYSINDTYSATTWS